MNDNSRHEFENTYHYPPDKDHQPSTMTLLAAEWLDVPTNNDQITLQNGSWKRKKKNNLTAGPTGSQIILLVYKTTNTKKTAFFKYKQRTKRLRIRLFHLLNVLFW